MKRITKNVFGISAGVLMVLFAGLGIATWINKEESRKTLDEVEVTDSAEVSEIVYKYGIPVDNYNVRYGIVQANQNLSVLLQKAWIVCGRSARVE